MLLRNKASLKLYGENNCANDMFLDRGRTVEPVRSGLGIIVNFEVRIEVQVCITGHAPCR